MSISEDQRTRFERDGYVVVDSGLPKTVLQGAIGDLAGYWGETRPAGVPMADRGRIQDAWMISENVYRIATHPPILEALGALYGRAPRPFQTLNFPVGTEQAVHTDHIHFNSEPFGLMCGVWVALEDIGPDQGPLIYYPKSQNWPELNFEDVGLEPSYEVYHRYEAALQGLIEDRGLQPAYGLMKRGQALIWAANLLHGGSSQNDPSLSRHSQVTHFFFEGVKCWRPGYSASGRAYFRPDWIPLEAGRLRRNHVFRRVVRKLLRRG